MEFKTRHLGIPAILFLVVIFLDQNSAPVPVKIFLGKPLHLELSLIVVISVLTGMMLTFGGMFFFRRMRAKDKD